jgi:hypothetical protein
LLGLPRTGNGGWLAGTLRCEQGRQLVDRLAADLGGKIERKPAPLGNLSVLILPTPQVWAHASGEAFAV